MSTQIQARTRSGRDRMTGIVLWSRPDDMTRFGISLPTGIGGGPPFRASSLADAARGIEAAGFESAWTFDSVGRGTLRPDPLMALAVVATVTRAIELGTGVLQVPLRNPVELAQRVLTVHMVSGGRFRFGVGAGSTAADFAALGVDFESRFRRLGESLAIMRRLWAGETVGGASLAPVWPAVPGGPRVRRLDRLGRPQQLAGAARRDSALPQPRRQTRRRHQRAGSARQHHSEPGRSRRSVRPQVPARRCP